MSEDLLHFILVAWNPTARAVWDYPLYGDGCFQALAQQRLALYEPNAAFGESKSFVHAHFVLLDPPPPLFLGLCSVVGAKIGGLNCLLLVLLLLHCLGLLFLVFSLVELHLFSLWQNGW